MTEYLVTCLNCERHNLRGATIYVGGPPCARCAAKIAQVGIKRVVCYAGTQAFRDRWARDLELANHIYNEVGIEFVEYPQPEQEEAYWRVKQGEITTEAWCSRCFDKSCDGHCP